MLLLILTNKTESKTAKWASVEGEQKASITTQLVKQKAKWAATGDGDHNTSITKHIEKKQRGNHKATKSYKE